MFVLGSEILEQMEERLIKDFLGVLTFSELTKGRPLGGYPIMGENIIVMNCILGFKKSERTQSWKTINDGHDRKRK